MNSSTDRTTHDRTTHNANRNGGSPALRRPIAAYLTLQALGGLSWWIGLVTEPQFLALFVPTGQSPQGLLTFWLADLVLFVGGSALGAIAVHRRWPVAHPVLWCVAGATAYGALWCIAQTLWTGEGWWCTLLMSPAALCTIACAWGAPAPCLIPSEH